MMLLFMFCLNFGNIDIQNPSIFVSDEHLVYPKDAVFLNNRLYVAGGDYEVQVFEGDVLVDIIGEKGQGPGEFEFIPVTVDITEEQTIMVVEFHGRNVSYFSIEHEFIRKEYLEKGSSDYFYGKTQDKFQKLREGLYKLKNLSQDCKLIKLKDTTDEEFYLGRFRLFQLGKDVLVLRKSGVVEIVDNNCHVKDKIQIKVGNFWREPEIDHFGNGVAGEYARIKNLKIRKLYLYGLPVIAATLQNERYLWLLISNEHNSGDRGKPLETWLYRLDLKTQEHHMQRLPFLASNIRYSGEFLTIISQDDAEIRAYHLP